MQVYAIGNLPLIKTLKNLSKWIQNWYADDGSCVGEFKNLKEWLKLLILEGSKHSYYNEVLIVAAEFVEQANKALRNKEFKC